MSKTKKPEKPIGVLMRLTPEQKAQLELLCERTRIPAAEFLREAIADLLKKYSKTLKAGGGK